MLAQAIDFLVEKGRVPHYYIYNNITAVSNFKYNRFRFFFFSRKYQAGSVLYGEALSYENADVLFVVLIIILYEGSVTYSSSTRHNLEVNTFRRSCFFI